jgi:signal transduction histidine kinase
MQLAGVVVSAEFQRQLDVAKQCLQLAAEEGRGLIGFIESQDRSDKELWSQIEEYVSLVETLAESQLQHLKLDTPFPLPAGLSAQQVWNILRIIQQAVQNAIQHAGPCSIAIGSELAENQWQVSVRDTGKGFSVDDVSPEAGHFGLMSMQQRAKSLPADLQVDSTVNGGTRVTLVIALPLPSAA